MKNPIISCRSHWNPSDKTASLFNKEEMLLFLISLCFHALCRANLTSTAARLLCMKGLGMYQCPQSGNPHFYAKEIHDDWCREKSVNALNRATLISTIHRTAARYRQRSVSMPSIGQPSFLPYPLRTGCFSRFAGSFLHVIFRVV